MLKPRSTVEEKTLHASIEELLAVQNRILHLLEGGHGHIKTWLTPAEFARAVGRSPYTIRLWLKQGRLIGRKRNIGRGRHFEWEISRTELEHYRNHGRERRPS